MTTAKSVFTPKPAPTPPKPPFNPLNVNYGATGYTSMNTGTRTGSTLPSNYTQPSYSTKPPLSPIWGLNGPGSGVPLPLAQQMQLAQWNAQHGACDGKKKAETQAAGSFGSALRNAFVNYDSISDGAFTFTRSITYMVTDMPNFGTSPGGYITVSNSPFYQVGSGGARRFLESTLMNGDDALSNAYRASNALGYLSGGIIVGGGVYAGVQEYRQSEGLDEQTRIANAITEGTWSIGSSVAIGAIIGSAVPGVGTLIGAGIGFLSGVIMNAMADSKIREEVIPYKGEMVSAMDLMKIGTNNLMTQIAQENEARLSIGASAPLH